MTDVAPSTPSGIVHTSREIEGLIPHRWPFLLVDRIVEYDVDAKRIVGLKAVTASEWFFQGHFPGLPVMPGVLQVEALAQTMAVYVAKQPGFGDRIGLFAGIDECRFKRVVQPGDTLRLEITMEKLGDALRSRSGHRQCRRRDGLRGPAQLHHPERRSPALMARIAVLSDVHGNSVALAATRAAIKAARVDAILVAGDHVMNGPDPAGALDGLRELESEGALVIQGNTDIAVADFDFSAAFPWQTDGVPDQVRIAAEWANEQLGPERLDWLRRLPAERRIRLEDVLVLVCHGSPGSQAAGFDQALDVSVTVERASRTDAQVIACGHTHICPRCAISAGSMIVNAGSAGWVFDGDPTASWALIDDRRRARHGRDPADAVRRAGGEQRADGPRPAGRRLSRRDGPNRKAGPMSWQGGRPEAGRAARRRHRHRPRDGRRHGRRVDLAGPGRRSFGRQPHRDVRSRRG